MFRFELIDIWGLIVKIDREYSSLRKFLEIKNLLVIS